MIALYNSNLHALFCEIKHNKYISKFKALRFYNAVYAVPVVFFVLQTRI